MPTILPQIKWRIALWSLALGVIVALPSGRVVESSSTVEVNGTGSVATLGTYFDPASALGGLLLGAAAGALIGTLWYWPRYGWRSRAGRAAAAVLLTGVGGLAGLVTAALVGAQTTIVVSGSSVKVDHGAPLWVLVMGFALGLALALWGVWRSLRLRREGPVVTA